MRIAVIGAGAAGLTTAKALRGVDLDPVVFEASEDIAGLWRLSDTGPAYRSLRTNTSKQVTAFSDAPFGQNLPDFPSRVAVEAYLREYSTRFGLDQSVRLKHRVTGVLPLAEGGWRLTIESGEGTEEGDFDAVVVCTGIFRRGALPALPGLDDFTGNVMHSSEYRVPEALRGQNVLVVGLGSSAGDIACDLVRAAGSVTLTTRRGASIAPRTISGRPLDHRGTRLAAHLPVRIRARRRREVVQAEFRRRHLPPLETFWPRFGIPFDPATAPGLTNDDLIPLVTSGSLALRPGIERIVGEEVLFTSGDPVCPDTIIMCTGYDLDFPFLPPTLTPGTAEKDGLYRLVFPPGVRGLAFVGVCRAQGPIFPIVEMQARWVAQVLAGRVALPSKERMAEEVRRRTITAAARGDSPIRVQLLPYLDDIGGLIGARPTLARHPRLVPTLLTGPPVAAQYRLEGFGAWSGARRVIQEAATRRR